MKVKNILEQLSKCDPEAEFEVRGTVNGEYEVFSSDDMGIDDQGDLVVLDI